MSFKKLKEWTAREPIRHVVVQYDACLGLWGIYQLNGTRGPIHGHKRRQECYRCLRGLGYIRQTRSMWSTLTDRVTAGKFKVPSPTEFDADNAEIQAMFES